jgi:flagellar biosynthesis/type III secretory pathway protein FliH
MTVSNSVPREVNGKWYPVPCPEFISLGQSFPSYEACQAACETSDGFEGHLDQLEYEAEGKIEQAVETAFEEEYHRGYSDGFDAFKDKMLEAIEAA